MSLCRTGLTFLACCPFCLCMLHFASDVLAFEQHICAAARQGSVASVPMLAALFVCCAAAFWSFRQTCSFGSKFDQQCRLLGAGVTAPMMPCRYHCEGDNSRWLGRSEDSRWNATWHDPGHVQEGGTPPWGCQLQRRSSGGQCIPVNAFSASMLVGLCIQGVTQETAMHMFALFLMLVL